MAADVPTFFKRHPAQREAISRLKDWTRERFRLPDADAVLVAELTCAVPGCPPVETVIAFWPAPGERRQFKIFKPATAIDLEDMPPWWMKDALMPPDSLDCQCC